MLPPAAHVKCQGLSDPTVNKRELIGLVMIVAAFALTPFAYGASVAFGVVAFAIGVAGAALFRDSP